MGGINLICNVRDQSLKLNSSSFQVMKTYKRVHSTSSFDFRIKSKISNFQFQLPLNLFMAPNYKLATLLTNKSTNVMAFPRAISFY